MAGGLGDRVPQPFSLELEVYERVVAGVHQYEAEADEQGEQEYAGEGGEIEYGHFAVNGAALVPVETRAP